MFVVNVSHSHPSVLSEKHPLFIPTDQAPRFDGFFAAFRAMGEVVRTKHSTHQDELNKSSGRNWRFHLMILAVFRRKTQRYLGGIMRIGNRNDGCTRCASGEDVRSGQVGVNCWALLRPVMVLLSAIMGET